MRNVLSKAALTLALSLAICAPAAIAKGKKTKHSAEHNAAVKKCEATYKVALTSTKTKKGKERKEAEMQAKKDEKQCIADAPQ